MVKVLVNGGLFEISKVEEIVEKRVPFNGTNIRLVQIAKDSKQAVSGLHFQVKNTECNVFAIGEFTIGNLPTAKVKEIMKQLLSDGYYDFSDCDFQPMMFVEKYKFDEGKSKRVKTEGRLSAIAKVFADYFDLEDANILSVEKDADFDDVPTSENENSEVDDDTASADEDSPAMDSFMNDPTEEAVDTEDMDTEGDDAEEVADEAGENSGISAKSE